MGIQYCLDSLKHSLHHLKALDKLADADKDIQRAITETASHASTVVFPMVQTLDAIYRGQPVAFDLVDEYTPIFQASTGFPTPSPSKLELLTLFIFTTQILGPSGLRHHLAHATDRQLFDTYRAIGGTTFTAFEVLVHQAVMGLEMEIEDLEMMAGAADEGFEHLGAAAATTTEGCVEDEDIDETVTVEVMELDNTITVDDEGSYESVSEDRV